MYNGQLGAARSFKRGRIYISTGARPFTDARKTRPIVNRSTTRPLLQQQQLYDVGHDKTALSGL